MSLLSGCFGLYLATLGLFALGISITPWHGLAFLASACLASFLVLDGQITERLKNTATILLLQLFLCGVLAGIASRFDDLSYDGMNARIEPVINLMSGWNPLLDPEFSQREKALPKHPFLRNGGNYQLTSGLTLAGILAVLTGEINAGKAVTPILGLGAFGIAFGGLTALGIPCGWAVVLAAWTALNPVTIYQSSSYYVDGHVAALFAATLFAGIRILKLPSLRGAAGFLFCWALLITAKVSGFFYGVILLLLGLFFWPTTLLRKAAVAGATVLVCGGLIGPLHYLHKSVGFSAAYWSQVQAGTSYAGGPNGYETWAPGLGAGTAPGRMGVFFRSHFAATAALADEPVKMKFPFWLNRRELAVFEDLSAQPYIGGFGPLYGACFLLSAASLLVIRRWSPAFSWIPLVASFGSIYFSQIWWARWTPQAWLIPIGFVLPVVCALQGRPPGRAWLLPLLSAFTGILNSALILAFYLTGCIKSQLTLESQLAFLQKVPQPLRIHMPMVDGSRLFKGCRIWFIRNHLGYELVSELPPRPRMKMHRTSTWVALPPGSNPEDDVPPATFNNWKKRKLIEP